MRSTRVRMVGVLVGALVISAGVAASGAAAVPPVDPGAREIRQAGDGSTVKTVTLVTGDSVRVTRRGTAPLQVLATPGKGRDNIAFVVRRHGTKVTVVPSDAAPLLAKGRLDPRLFDVTELIEMEYDDQSTMTIPLIVEDVATPQTLAGAGVQQLASLGASAVKTSKPDAAAFWRTASASGAAMPRIWLDGRMRMSLDSSVPQIGAPKAWAKGYTGKGIRVAVLDTGIDETHADLRGAVVARKDFAGTGSTTDKLGHGTHVASIITGNGARSKQKYQGVAPDAVLLNAKVLADDGWGNESTIIAGMEWAVQQKARIVNLSLGGPPTDGTDPVSAALNRLSASSGALFVVAAGNDGAFSQGVSAPASADQALAVAAVDRGGRTAEFSSVGPRFLDRALKPEIAGPGVDIVAARAAGTEFGDNVNAYYTRLSGTSMAAPHVAGAAAILAQRHTTYKAQYLKSLLTSTASQPAASTVFQQGAGLVDVSRAVAQTVWAMNNQVSAYLAWPHKAVTAKAITYRNPYGRPLTLDLSFAGQATPAGMFSVPKSITIPARAHGKVMLKIDPRKGKLGQAYGGRVIAKAAGGISVRTPVSAFVEAEAYDLELAVTNASGEKVTRLDAGFLQEPMVVDPDSGRAFPVRERDGRLIARVPPGQHSVTAALVTRFGQREVCGSPATLLADPLVKVDKDTVLALDARRARPVTAHTDVATAKPIESSIAIGELVGNEPFETRISSNCYRLHALPTEKADRPYDFAFHTVMRAPRSTYELVLGNRGRVPVDPSYRVADTQLSKATMDFSVPGVAAKGSWTHTVDVDNPQVMGFGAQYDIAMPSKRTHLVSPTYAGKVALTWRGGVTVEESDSRSHTEFGPSERHVAGGRTTIGFSRAAFGPSGGGTHDSNNGVWLYFGPLDPASGGGYLADGDLTGKATLRRGGKLIGTSSDPTTVGADNVPGGAAVFVAEMSATHRLPWSAYATAVKGKWTFTSTPPSTDAASVPMLRPRVTGAFDGFGRAPAGKAFPLTLDLTGGAPAANVAKPTLALSFDDGKTWQPVPLRSDEGRWAATPKLPDVAKGVGSFRITARDSKGNSVEVTSIRAFAVVR